MKLSVDRQEKKGLFGGAYYETTIRVTLTPEEEQVARKQKIMNIQLIGDGNPQSGDTVKLLGLCNRSRLSLSDLTIGITATAKGNQLGTLGWLEDEVRSQCKNIKNNIEADSAFGQGGQSYEEEI